MKRAARSQSFFSGPGALAIALWVFTLLAPAGARETRTQLEENGKKKVVPNAELNDAGKAAVRSKAEVIYKNFKIFTVEVEVR